MIWWTFQGIVMVYGLFMHSDDWSDWILLLSIFLKAKLCSIDLVLNPIKDFSQEVLNNSWDVMVFLP